MIRLQFNHFFLFLLGLTFLCAFVFPPAWTDPLRGQLEGIFVPVSHPSRNFAIWLQNRISPTLPSTRQADELEEENQLLRQQIASDQIDIQRLSTLAGERQQMGNLSALCQRWAVVGADTSGRDGLIISGTATNSLKQLQPVLDGRRAVIGRIDRTGINSGHVRMITDSGFSVNAKFYRFSTTDNHSLTGGQIGSVLHPRVVGRGRGQISIPNITMQQIQDAQLTINDWVVLDDNSWPQPAQNCFLGQIVAIRPSMMASGFAEINLSTEEPILQLGDVWVMTQDSPTMQ